MPLFPPQSPDNPVMADKFQEAAPAPVISMKSDVWIAFEADVIVLAVPTVEE